MSHFQIKQGATGPTLRVTLYGSVDPITKAKIAVNLTGATITMRMKSKEGGPLVISNGAVAIVGDPLDGTIEYDWQAGDTDTVGEYDVEWVVTYAGGDVQVFPIDGYTEVEIEAALGADTGPAIPALPDYCWPINEAACDELDTYSASVRARAFALAGMTLRMLTVGQVGGCPITVRPCSVACATSYGSYTGGVFTPHINIAGAWVNGCGCASSCNHLGALQITMPGIVGRVDEIKIDGVVIPPTSYRIDNGRDIVRTDGEPWPVVQDMALADTEPGTFSITYLPARPVDGLGAWAAGILACEYAKAITNDKKCRLPSGVRDITRQGVSMTITTGLFPDGLTGINEVDIYVRSINPYALKTPPAVWSPDRRSPRRTP